MFHCSQNPNTGPKSSTLGLLTEYLAGEKDSSLNLNNLKKQLKEAA